MTVKKGFLTITAIKLFMKLTSIQFNNSYQSQQKKKINQLFIGGCVVFMMFNIYLQYPLNNN